MGGSILTFPGFLNGVVGLQVIGVGVDNTVLVFTSPGKGGGKGKVRGGVVPVVPIPMSLPAGVVIVGLGDCHVPEEASLGIVSLW